MRKLVLVATFGILFALLLAACGGSSSGGGSTSGGGSSNCSASNFTMGATTFCSNAITIKQGETITFVDDANTGTMHILVIGTDGQSKPEQGAPDFGGSAGHSFQPGDKWTTPAWNTPGTYHVTCTVHPTTMNLIVTVTS